MYKSLLVPLDGSTFAEHALPVAQAIARRSGARLVLVSVSTPLAEAYVEGMYFSTSDLQEELTARHQEYLEAVAARVRSHIDVPIAIVVKHGEVAPTLCEMLEAGEADLVVMATHGRGAMGRFWLGSVADEMIRHTTAPVLLVRPGEQDPDLAREPDLRSVLVPLDGTELAEAILAPALGVAGLLPDSEVILARAIHSVLPVKATPDVPEARREARSILQHVQTLQNQVRVDAESYLEKVAARVRERGLKVRTRIIVEDNPARGILEEADRQQAGMIAIATHARTGLSRMVVGSVADKVVRGAHVPVLIHHPANA